MFFDNDWWQLESQSCHSNLPSVVPFQKIFIPTQRKVNGNYKEVGVSKAKISKESRKLSWYGYFLQQHISFVLGSESSLKFQFLGQ